MAQVTAVPIGADRVTTDDEIVVASPYDGSEVGRVPSCGAAHVGAAVAAARAAWPSRWRPTPARRCSTGPRRCWPSARRTSPASSRPRPPSPEDGPGGGGPGRRHVPVQRARPARWPATWSRWRRRPRRGQARLHPAGADRGGRRHQPVQLPAQPRGPQGGAAIAAGCPVVLKPASQALSALALAHLLLDECGLPAGWLNVVTGSGGAVGDPLVTHDDVAMVTFTGSPPVGWSIRQKVPRKKVSLELGNNSPVIIEADGDWRAAVAKLKVAGFSHAGQSCISSQRVLVHRSIHDDLVAELVEAVGSLVVGPPLDEDTDVSASSPATRPSGSRRGSTRRSGRVPRWRSATPPATASCGRPC